MAEHPNLQRLRLGYEAYASGDLATLRELPYSRWREYNPEDSVWLGNAEHGEGAG